MTSRFYSNCQVDGLTTTNAVQFVMYKDFQLLEKALKVHITCQLIVMWGGFGHTKLHESLHHMHHIIPRTLALGHFQILKPSIVGLRCMSPDTFPLWVGSGYKSTHKTTYVKCNSWILHLVVGKLEGGGGEVGDGKWGMGDGEWDVEGYVRSPGSPPE